MYTHTYTHIHIYTHTHIHIYTCIYTHNAPTDMFVLGALPLEVSYLWEYTDTSCRVHLVICSTSNALLL